MYTIEHLYNSFYIKDHNFRTLVKQIIERIERATGIPLVLEYLTDQVSVTIARAEEYKPLTLSSNLKVRVMKFHHTAFYTTLLALCRFIIATEKQRKLANYGITNIKYYYSKTSEQEAVKEVAAVHLTNMIINKFFKVPMRGKHAYPCNGATYFASLHPFEVFIDEQKLQKEVEEFKCYFLGKQKDVDFFKNLVWSYDREACNFNLSYGYRDPTHEDFKLMAEYNKKGMKLLQKRKFVSKLYHLLPMSFWEI